MEWEWGIMVQKGLNYPNRFERLFTLIHTLLVRRKFFSFGKGSRVEFPSRQMRPDLVAIGKSVQICEHSWINASGSFPSSEPTLTIGDNVYIGRFGQINAWGSVVIEQNALIADRVFISDSGHCHDDLEAPIITQGTNFIGSVLIREGCWIGIGVTVLPGVTIGKGAIIGANSVVTRDIPDFAIAYGVPAVVRKMRSDK